MNATTHDLGFRGIAGLRGFVQWAQPFFTAARSVPMLEKRAAALEIGAARVLEIVESPTDIETIAALVQGAPGVVSGFIQQTLSLEQENVVRVPGGAGAWIHGHSFRTRYRVFIHTGSKFCECTDADLLKAVRTVFAELQLPLPKGLA